MKKLQQSPGLSMQKSTRVDEGRKLLKFLGKDVGTYEEGG